MTEDNNVPSMIVIMGVTGAGKSYFINQLAKKEVVKEGFDLDSCTQACALVPITIGRSRVLVIDTPGFDDGERTDSEILTEISRILAAQYELGVELKGVIYIHRITDIRYSRAAVKTFEIFKKICGQTALSNVLLVTSRWEGVDPATGAGRERQLKDKFWAYMLGHGSNMSRFHGDRPSAVGLVSQLLQKDTVVLQLQKELVSEGKQLEDTAAGAYVSNNLEKLKEKYQQELAALEELKNDLLNNDRAMKRQIQRDWDEYATGLDKVRSDQVSLQRPVGEEVRQEIRKKKSGFSKVLPFLPMVVSVLAAFAGVPPGVTDIFASWFGFSDLSEVFSF